MKITVPPSITWNNLKNVWSNHEFIIRNDDKPIDIPALYDGYVYIDIADTRCIIKSEGITKSQIDYIDIQNNIPKYGYLLFLEEGKKLENYMINVKDSDTIDSNLIIKTIDCLLNTELQFVPSSSEEKESRVCDLVRFARLKKV